jgi:DNA-binding PadR family transcriptional regulator
MHAYEIHQMLAQSKELGRVWHLKQSQLYALLGRLEEAGYLTTTTETQGNRPPRKMMSLTDAGRQAFATWLTTPVAHGRDFRLEFLAKLYFADESGAETVAQLLRDQRATSLSWLTQLRAQAEVLKPDRRFDWLVLQFRVNQIEAILSWLDTCEQTLSRPDGDLGF